MPVSLRSCLIITLLLQSVFSGFVIQITHAGLCCFSNIQASTLGCYLMASRLLEEAWQCLGMTTICTVMCIMCIQEHQWHWWLEHTWDSLEKPLQIELQFGGSSATQWRLSAVVGGNQIVNTPSAKVALEDLCQQVPEEHTHGFECLCVCVCVKATPPKYSNTRVCPSHLH